ncbi:type IVB secretion system protein IcmH/DotU, partial [Aestuariivita sp.]|uniref:type IVB secretion system protein IcmH/DotU n=1 Tax=Aestuariivita sp. TaxID=1872407 RepID=UPI003BAED713
MQNDDERTVLAPRPVDLMPVSTMQIPLAEAVNSGGRAVVRPTNPVLAAADDLLGLLGLLRTGLVEMDKIELREHLSRALTRFQSDARSARAPEEDVAASAYALAATCDDIAQNLPGADVAYWRSNGLTHQLFGDPNPGVGFFTRLHRLSGNPAQRSYTLELMFACLALGFEGQYRTAPDGALALTNLRTDLYRRFRATLPRPQTSLSPSWLPVVLARGQRHARVPLWIIAGVGAAMV